MCNTTSRGGRPENLLFGNVYYITLFDTICNTNTKKVTECVI